jgi:hypothetical protein
MRLAHALTGPTSKRPRRSTYDGRLLVLLGPGVENQQTFASQVARKLDASGRNFAMASYGTVQSEQMIRRHRDLAPKIIIYGFVTDHMPLNGSGCGSSYYPFCLDLSHVTRDETGQFAIAPSGKQRRAPGRHSCARPGWLA